MQAMRTLILLSAIPGSGKSTYAKHYAATHPNTYIVSSDEVRKRIAGSLAKFDKEPEVWETFLSDINSYAEKYEEVTVIADATNLQNKYRRYYCEATPAFDRHVLVYFDIPFEVCLVQNKMREGDRVVPEKAMLKLKEEFEPVSEEVKALYDEYIVLGPDYVSPLIKKIRGEN